MAKSTASKRPTKRRHRRTASTADKHELYELSVQNVEAECDFIDQVWKGRRGRLARHIREDFCGTAATTMAWIKRRPDNTAVGVDIDPKVLAWARSKMPERLTPDQQKRLTLKQGDVLETRTRQVESVLAMNFSYYLFKMREDLGRYFKRARASLVDDGMLILDVYGGSDAFVEMEEKRKLNGFTYIWDQHSYNPITGDVVNYIHYRFPDGSEMRRAFRYDWRLWTLPELRELLGEAGFATVTVYWEGTDAETGEGNDEFRPTLKGDADPGWIAYIVAEK